MARTTNIQTAGNWEMAPALPRLARIETRRSPAFWFVPVLIAIAWFAGREQYDDGVTLWVWTSASIGFNLLVIGPLLGGLAAWEAGRERRRGMGDLLLTTPRPPIARDLSRWVAVTAWGLVAYLMFGAYLFAVALREATWGGPDFSPMVVGLVGLATYSAVGYAAGSLVPSRFIAPLVPLFLLGVFHLLPVGIVDRNQSTTRFLSPYSFLNPDEHWISQGIWPDISVAMVMWLAGIAGTALAIVGIHRARTTRAVGTLLVAVAVATAGAALILRTEYGAEARQAATIPFDPVCIDASIPVCSHPAYSAVLDETGAVVEILMAPLAGIDGTPSRITNLSRGDTGFAADGTLAMPLYAPANGSEQLAQDLARLLLTSDAYREGCFFGIDNAQYAVAEALLQRGGWSLERHHGPTGIATCETHALIGGSDGGSDTSGGPPGQRPEIIAMETEIQAAADRFAALTIAEQRAWFTNHYADLRAGNLTLEDLP